VFVRKKSLIAEANLRIIRRVRVERGDLYSTNAFCPHFFQLALQVGLGDCGTKPPPSHHDSAVIRWIRK
jgi:hypothetical protein